MGGNAPGFIRWAARGTLEERLGPDAEPVLESAARRYVEEGSRAAGAGGRVALYLAALRAALMERGCSAQEASSLVAGSVARAMERLRLPLEVAAWSRHPRNRLARARWRQREEERLFFRRPTLG